MSRALGIEAIQKIKGVREAAIASAGILLVDTFFRQEAAIRAGAGLGEHLADSVPSGFVAPQVSDDFLGRPNHSVDLAIDTGLLSGSTVLARQTTSLKAMAATAAGAQILASAADGIIAEGNFLDRAEAANQDVGSSAIMTAFGVKFMLDRVAVQETKWRRRAWGAATGAFAVGATFGAAYVDSKNAVTDFSSHASGLAAGIVAHSVAKRPSTRR